MLVADEEMTPQIMWL